MHFFLFSTLNVFQVPANLFCCTHANTAKGFPYSRKLKIRNSLPYLENSVTFGKEVEWKRQELLAGKNINNYPV
jgi:hypothetical protein